MYEDQVTYTALGGRNLGGGIDNEITLKRTSDPSSNLRLHLVTKELLIQTPKGQQRERIPRFSGTLVKSPIPYPFLNLQASDRYLGK